MIKKCLVIENSYKEDSSLIGKKINDFLSERNVDVTSIVVDSNDKKIDFNGYDFVITLGGDGTVLFASRGCAPLEIPVFPINLGEFGFIAGIQKNAWQDDLNSFLNGKLSPVDRNMINVSVLRDGKTIFSSIGLNDVVLSSLLCAQMSLFEVVYNTSALGNFKSDGLIVSTATGSTAYSVSAGGPIVDPELDAFVLTSVNSFSLSARPLVFNPEGKLTIKLLPCRNDSIQAVVDGQKTVTLKTNDLVIITKAEHKARLIGCNIENFYEVLRSKLNWAGGPHA